MSTELNSEMHMFITVTSKETLYKRRVDMLVFVRTKQREIDVIIENET